MAILLGAWGASGATPTCDPRADIDHDGTVGASDLALLLGDWNVTCTCTAPDDSFNEMSSFGSGGSQPTEQQLAWALSALGFGSVDAYAAWFAEADEETINGVNMTLSALLVSAGGDDQ